MAFLDVLQRMMGSIALVGFLFFIGWLIRETVKDIPDKPIEKRGKPKVRLIDGFHEYAAKEMAFRDTLNSGKTLPDFVIITDPEKGTDKAETPFREDYSWKNY